MPMRSSSGTGRYGDSMALIHRMLGKVARLVWRDNAPILDRTHYPATEHADAARDGNPRVDGWLCACSPSLDLHSTRDQVSPPSVER